VQAVPEKGRLSKGLEGASISDYLEGVEIITGYVRRGYHLPEKLNSRW
jgi:hypothetical protein